MPLLSSVPICVICCHQFCSVLPFPGSDASSMWSQHAKACCSLVRIHAWRCLSLLPQEGESLEGHSHSRPPYLSCPHGVGKKRDWSYHCPKPIMEKHSALHTSWAPGSQGTPAPAIIPLWTQGISNAASICLPQNMFFHILVTDLSWSASASASTSILTQLGLTFCGTENAIGVYKTWGDPVKNPAVWFFSNQSRTQEYNRVDDECFKHENWYVLGFIV